MNKEEIEKIMDDNFICTCDIMYTSRGMVDLNCVRHYHDEGLENLFIAGANSRQAEIDELKDLLVKYEAWEAELISDNRCWAPAGMATYPRLTSELYDKMLEMQSERNDLLGTFKNVKR